MLEKENKKKSKVPHVYVLLVAIILVCAALTWVLPAGEFDREPNESGRMMVVPNTYHHVDPNPVGPMKAVQAIYEGMIDAGPIIFFVFVSFASIGIIVMSGAFNGLVAGLLKLLKGRARVAIIPIFITIIGIGSSTIGLFEEMMPFIPIFIGISIAMGYDAIVGLAIVSLGCGLGYSGAFMNPFNVGLAQSIAEIPVLSGSGYRIFCHIVMITVASIYTIRYALKIQKDPTKSLVYGQDFGSMAMSEDSVSRYPFGIREKLVLLTLVTGLTFIVLGASMWGWYFSEYSAIFLIVAFVAAVIMGWGPSVLAEKLGKGFTDIAVACLLIGIARGILVVLRDGNIIDTVVYGISVPLSYLPRWIAAEAMLLVQTLLNFLIPSGSGMASTSMPIMAPLSDILGVSRQISVLAFQFGDGISNVLWPTATTPIFCGIAGIKMEKWWKWFVPCFLLLFVTQFILILIALMIGYQ